MDKGERDILDRLTDSVAFCDKLLAGINMDDCAYFNTLPPLDGPVTLKDGTVIKPRERGNVLNDAMQTINGPRQDTYGNPEDSFERIANLWDAYLSGKYGSEIDITAQDVALMMSLMKIARMMTGAGQRDSYVDACGYIALAADMQGGE